jgi:hypothetical protein
MTGGSTEPATNSHTRPVAGRFSGHGLLLVASVVFVIVVSPVLIRGAPMADDFPNCLRPVREGLGGMFASSLDRLGAVRPARFVEILVTTGACQHLAFWVAIAVPLVLTLAVAWLLAGLLSDMGSPGWWPQIGGVLWLLQPLGAEAALWPAALHVPLALVCGLGALRLFVRGRHIAAGVLALAAMLSAEQTIVALPIAAWLVTPPEQRRTAGATCAGATVVVLGVYASWTGQDPRFAASIADRARGLVADPWFYLRWVGLGLGAQSIPLGVWWAWPVSIPLAAAAAAAGWALAGRTRERSRATWPTVRALVWFGALLIAANLPLLLNVPRQGSPRTFTPTWLILVAGIAMIGPTLPWARLRAVGAVAGILTVGAACSIALTVAVRVESARFFEEAVRELADRSADGDVIAVCDVPRTVTEPSLRGAYAVHDLLYPWSASDGLEYYTGREATVLVAGPGPGGQCPRDADVHVDFTQLGGEPASEPIGRVAEQLHGRRQATLHERRLMR